MDPKMLRPAQWYRPGHHGADEGAAGTYQVRDDGSTEVWMHGSWYDVPSMALMGVAELIEDFPSLIHGDVFGKRVTLVGVTQGTSHTNNSRLQVTEIRSDYAFEGHWLDESELMVTEAQVHFLDQDIWSGWFAFPASIPFEGERLSGIKAWYEKPEEVTCQVADGTITLADQSSHRQYLYPNGWDLRSKSIFKFKFEQPIEIDVFRRDYLAPIEFLLTSATGRRSGAVSIRVTNEDWVIPNERHVSQRWATLRTRHPEPHGDTLTDSALLHRLEDFDFPMHFPRLFDVATTLRYPLEHYAILRSGISLGPLAEFIAAAQLVESTQRALDASEKRKSLATRLKELDAATDGMIASIIEDDEWSDHVAELRNVVAHGYGGSRVLTEDQRSVQVGTALLELLFEVRLLVALGFAPAEARRLAVQRANHGWTARTIREGYPLIKEVAQWKPRGGPQSS